MKEAKKNRKSPRKIDLERFLGVRCAVLEEDHSTQAYRRLIEKLLTVLDFRVAFHEMGDHNIGPDPENTCAVSVYPAGIRDFNDYHSLRDRPQKFQPARCAYVSPKDRQAAINSAKVIVAEKIITSPEQLVIVALLCPSLATLANLE